MFAEKRTTALADALLRVDLKGYRAESRAKCSGDYEEVLLTQPLLARDSLPNANEPFEVYLAEFPQNENPKDGR